MLTIPRMQFRQTGFSMIEVLVTILIVSFGLMGLAALQTRFLSAEMESYQRSQALSLVQDMAARMAANRAQTFIASGTSAYVTGTSSPVGTGDTPAADCLSLSTLADTDKCEWSKALQGASETITASSTKVGAMIGARGCIEQVSTDPYVYRISVAWQGVGATATPSLACGSGLYGSNDAFRRVLSIDVAAPKLVN